jgi:hypothetical protein
MQKLINDPKDFVGEVLQGILKAHGDDLSAPTPLLGERWRS